MISFVLLFTFCLQLDISYDKFVWTTDPKHEAIVKEVSSRVLVNGDVFWADYEGLCRVNCEEYNVFFFAFELVNVAVATLSKFNFPYLLIDFLFTYFLIDYGVIELSIVENFTKTECFFFFFCGCYYLCKIFFLYLQELVDITH